MKHAADAINCYLHAAGLPSAKRPRQYLARVLWLISLDDDSGILTKSYESYKSDIAIWNWIPFIPQLLSSLGGKESKITRGILTKIAKTHPQALHFQLKTAKEEFNSMKRHHHNPSVKTPDSSNNEIIEQQSVRLEEDAKESENAISTGSNNQGQTQQRRKPWEFVEELTGLLKTAFPLLALSMEAMVEQILQRLKPTTDEDIYRLIVALLNDGVQVLFF